MVDYSHRKIRHTLFSLYNIHKDCVLTCINLEILTKTPAYTLYDELEHKLHINTEDFTSILFCLVLKCIIVQTNEYGIKNGNDVSKDSSPINNPRNPLKKGPKGKKQLQVIKNGSEKSISKYNNTHSYIYNPTLMFNSELGKALRKFCGYTTFTNILKSHRVLIPTSIYNLSQTSLYSSVSKLDDLDPKYASLLKLSRIILNRKYRFREGDNLMNCSTVFVQCSGDVLIKQNIKLLDKERESKNKSSWSRMVLYKRFLFFKGKIKGRKLLNKTLFEEIENDDVMICKFLSFILSNNQFFSEKLNERKKSIKSFLETVQDSKKIKIASRKSIFYNLFTHFKKFINNVHLVDWHCKKYLASQTLEGTGMKTVSISNVYAYIKNIVEQTISPELLCGESNYQRFLKVCYSIISLNKGENLCMSEVMKGINIKNCTWTKSKYHCRGQTRTVLEYLCRVIFVILQYFIIPSIGRHLHITESCFSMYKIHYIRTEDWVKMVESARGEYLSNGEIMNKMKEPNVYPKIRFIPKHFGMRPILNCNTSKGCMDFRKCLFNKYRHAIKSSCECYLCDVRKKMRDQLNLNSMLKLILQALTVNSKVMPILGNGVLGYNSFYIHLKRWWVKFIRSLKSVDDVKLYYFIADLSKCYERIPHDKLMQVLNDLPLLDSKFWPVYKRFFVKLASRVNSFGKIEELVTFSSPKMNNLSFRLYSNSIIASTFENQKTLKVTKFDILSAVSTLISSQRLELPNSERNNYMKLNRGIPQGCCVSPFLSSIYLASFDKDLSSQLKSKFVLNDESLTIPNFLVRWIDDILFLSTNPEDVNNLSKFLTSDNFAPMVNPKKFITNTFPNGPELCLSQHGSNALEWINCRFNFDIKNRFINVELVPFKFSEIKIRDTICLSRSHYGTFMFSLIEQRLVGYISNKLFHKTYTCSKINSPECIISNSYVVFRTCSMKLRCSIKVLVDQFGGFVNHKYFYKLIMNLLTITLNLVSRGGLNTRKHNLREILMIAVINTFWDKSLKASRSTSKSKSKSNYLVLINRKIMRRLYYHVKSLPNQRSLFSLASKVEEKHKKNWTQLM